MLIETKADLAPFDSLQIELPEVGFTQAIIIWNSGRFYGCEFNEPVSQAAVSAALLRSVPKKPVELVAATSVVERKIPTAADVPAGQGQTDSDLEDEKASVSTRLRVIFGSAIILWALIIWAVRSLIKMF